MTGSRTRGRDQRGAITVIVALSITALLITGGIVLDIGFARLDRKINKSTADDAVTAGLQAANSGTGDVYNSSAVCAAYAFLKSHRGLSDLPSDVCSTVDTTRICKPGDPTNDVSYHGTTTAGNRRYEVWIKMPYKVSDSSTGGSFNESPATLSSDPGESLQAGCDQLGVVIKEWSQPGLSRIVSANELVTRVRSVARLKVGNGDPAPALLLLERIACGVLSVGSSGSPSRIRVYGSATSPGTIHSDSTATDPGCGSGPNQQLLQGKQAGGVVAYGAGTGAAGLITTVATQNGRPSSTVIDSGTNVYATSALNEFGVGTPSALAGRKPVTRRPIDTRYRAGVMAATMAARAVWATDHVTHAGFPTAYGCPSATDMTAMAAMTVAQSVYIDCPGASGITLNGTIGAGTVYFHGFIKNGTLSMPNATSVYVDDTDNGGARISGDAISLTNNTAFCVRATTCSTVSPSSGTCLTTPPAIPSPSAKAKLFLRRGALNGSGGNSLLRLCNTTVIMEGGDTGSGTAADPGGCVPTTTAFAPTGTPCATTPTSGDGFINTSGAVDWTPPNAYGDMTAAGLTGSQQQAAWGDGEDLALWTESAGTSSDFKMAGGATFHVAGVFMAPNASPFNITGSGALDLSNAQFVIRSFAVDGGATLTMRVDPNNVVGLPSLYDFRMVR